MGFNLAMFAKQLTVFSVVLFAAYAFIAYFLPEKYTSKAFWGFVPFFYSVVMASRAFLHKLTSKSKQNFSLYFVQTNVYRLLLYVGVLLIYTFNFPDDAAQFMITFFVFYFAYTIFEIVFLYRNMISK